MRSPLAALLTSVSLAVAVVAVSGCGDSDKPSQVESTKGPGMDPSVNAATTTAYFRAVASNDPIRLRAAFELAAPRSPALSYLHLVIDGLPSRHVSDHLTANNGRYRICAAEAPKRCHTYAAIVLTDGKVNDFTIDGKRIRIR